MFVLEGIGTPFLTMAAGETEPIWQEVRAPRNENGSASTFRNPERSSRARAQLRFEVRAGLLQSIEICVADAVAG